MNSTFIGGFFMSLLLDAGGLDYVGPAFQLRCSIRPKSAGVGLVVLSMPIAASFSPIAAAP
jgi:hypothetical protein